jgi:hypothetical protein
MGRLFVFLIIGLVGCARVNEATRSEKFVPSRSVSSIVSDTMVGTFQGAWIAVQTPLEDIGLKRQTIPEELQKIKDNPYAPPPLLTCEILHNEIARLDILLGPEVCTIDNPTGREVSHKGEYVEKGAGVVRNRAVDMVQSKMNFIPFRGVVRNISGANKHAEEVEQAYQAGRLRRAFLKGLSTFYCGPYCPIMQPVPQFSPALVPTR